jgi:hypothetical protein
VSSVAETERCEATLALLAERKALREAAAAAVDVMTPATVTRVPNQPKTPMRSFRIPDDVYRAAQAKAAAKGETVSDVIRKALERYVKRP